MVYNTAADLIVLLGLADAADLSAADILIFQTSADAMIDSFPNSAADALKATIELELVWRMVVRSRLLHNKNNSGLDMSANEVFRPVVMTIEEKRMMQYGQVWSP